MVNPSADALHPACSLVEAGVVDAKRREAKEGLLGERPAERPQRLLGRINGQRNKRAAGSENAAPREPRRTGPPAGYGHGEWTSVQVCEGPVWALECSPRGVVATGGSDGCVSLVRMSDAWGDVVKLYGHEGPVFDVSWAPEEDNERSLLATASGDGTTRVWKVDAEPLEASWIMVFAHGGAVFACCFLDRSTLATGGMDRNLRLWHLPSNKATQWAHCNDAVTAVACTPAKVGWRVAVGLRGGQIFAYTSRAHDRLDFDEMFLTTVRAGAFFEAERVGTSGLADARRGTDDDDETVVVEAAKDPPPRHWRLFPGRRRRRQTREPDRDQVVTEALVGDLSDDDEAAPPALATPDFVRRRVTRLAWYVDTRDSKLVAASNSTAAKIFRGSRPDKPPVKILIGGVRSTLGCGAEPSQSGKRAVGGSEDGVVAVWSLETPAAAIAEPALIPVPGVPGARVHAITRALFAPPDVARDLLRRHADDDHQDQDDQDPSAAFVLATDYNGRLMALKRDMTTRLDETPATNNPLALEYPDGRGSIDQVLGGGGPDHNLSL